MLRLFGPTQLPDLLTFPDVDEASLSDVTSENDLLPASLLLFLLTGDSGKTQTPARSASRANS